MRLVLAGLVLGSAIGLVACGDDSTGPDEDSLTREEALALVKAATRPGFEVITENSALEGEIPDPGSLIQQEFTAPCLMGGTVTVSNLQAEFMGDPDSDEDVSVSLSMTMIHSDCVVPPEDTGLALTLNGAPKPGHKSRNVHHGRPWVRLERRGGWYGSLGHGRRSERILPDRSGHRGGDRPIRVHFDPHRAGMWSSIHRVRRGDVQLLMNTGQGLSRPGTTSWLPLRISESSRPSEAAHELIGDSDLDRDPLHDVAGDVPQAVRCP